MLMLSRGHAENLVEKEKVIRALGYFLNSPFP